MGQDLSLRYVDTAKNMMTLLRDTHTGNGGCSTTRFILKTAFNPLFKHGAGETGPLKGTGVSKPRNQTVTVLRLFPLIITA